MRKSRPLQISVVMLTGSNNNFSQTFFMGSMIHPSPVTGTIGPVTIYWMFGKQYIRAKSSLTRKRVLKSKAFEKTRKCARDLGRAATIASAIYKALPEDIRERWLFRAITGEAASLLYEGKEEQDVKDSLWKKYITGTHCEAEAIMMPAGNNINHSSKKVNMQLREVFLERWISQGRSYYYFKRAWQKRGYFNAERFREMLENTRQPWKT